MTQREAEIIKALLQDKIDVRGQCKILSEALGKIEKCECTLCQIARIDAESLATAVNKIERLDLYRCGHLSERVELKEK